MTADSGGSDAIHARAMLEQHVNHVLLHTGDDGGALVATRPSAVQPPP